MNRFNDVEETGDGNATDTFTQVIEDKDEIVAQMKKVRQTLFDYSYDNAEEFSSEISTEEDKAVLLDLKQALESAKNMANLVRTFGDEDMKEQFAKLETRSCLSCFPKYKGVLASSTKRKLLASVMKQRH